MPHRSPSLAWLERIAMREVGDTLDALPPELGEAAGAVPVTCEAWPGDEQVAEGLEPDILGLFVGESHAETGGTLFPLPAQIILYLANIWDFANGSERLYRAEVRKTYLHELGHYLGMDEEDLYERGMD